MVHQGFSVRHLPPPAEVTAAVLTRPAGGRDSAEYQLTAHIHNGYREKYADHRGGTGIVWIVNSLPYLSPRLEGQADAWSEEAARAGRAGTQHIREVATAVPPAEVATALVLPAGALAVVRRRTMLLDGEPVEMTDSWYPAEIAAGTALAAPGKIKGGAVTLLGSLGYTVREAREDIVFRAAAADEAAELAVRAGTPVIVLSRTCLTAAAVPFETSVMVMVAEGRRLRYQLIAG